ncbi:hypothetical protein BCR32DRAFT_305152 [Anaeromyces robustus]|uniref:Uncharacterized protein n=1 Tax=Anaeromyces robustus TaxID=1754192 RepID=A0A1Y1WJJ8_9FUNG|nr:hypothetical protein BCR32DRAFT_305152 [Anaeromyces robustus]|eukprot:ORX73525.1 hypothetical protein BCR32DRAFT_305152 [Anaeromyces robustus]
MRLVAALPRKWKEILVEEEICPDSDDDHYDDIWEFINNKLAQEALIKEYSEFVSLRFGGGSSSRNYNKKRRNSHTSKRKANVKENPFTEIVKYNRNKSYRAYKKDNKYKREISHYNEAKKEKEEVNQDKTNETKKDINTAEKAAEELANEFQNYFTTQERTINYSFVNHEDPITIFQKYKDKAQSIQSEIDTIQAFCPVKEIQYTRAMIPISNEVMRKVYRSERAVKEFSDREETGMVNALMIVDSGSSVNLISKKLAKTLGLKIFPVKSEIVTNNGNFIMKEGTIMSLAVFLKNPPNYIAVCHNMTFGIVNQPEHMLAIGKNMERKYNLKLHRIVEITNLLEDNDLEPQNNLNHNLAQAQALQEFARNNAALQTNRVEDRDQQSVARLQFRGQGNPHNMVEIPITGVNHYNLLKEFNINKLLDDDPKKGYLITIGNKEEKIKNDELIKKLLPDELKEFKDVFDIPKGLYPEENGISS